MAIQINLEKYQKALQTKQFVCFKGQVTKVVGLTIESNGPETHVGELCRIMNPRLGKEVLAEVVGFRDRSVLLMPLGEMTGIAPGNDVVATSMELSVGVSQGLLGRVLDGLGNPMDGKGRIEMDDYYAVNNMPPHPMERPRLRCTVLGVKCIDGMLTVGKGQNGHFRGKRRWKSTLMGMIARNTRADINVIRTRSESATAGAGLSGTGFAGDGLKRSVVIVATSDQPALIRKPVHYWLPPTNIFGIRAMTCCFNGFTHPFSMAQRKSGFPSVNLRSQGYTPSVFLSCPSCLNARVHRKRLYYGPVPSLWMGMIC